MVATDLGVYILNSGATTWNNYSLGLPNVIISDIEFNPALNKAYVSTFGRGIWETNLALISGLQKNELLKTLDFLVYPSINCGLFSIEMKDISKSTRLSIFDVSGRIVLSDWLKENKTEIKLNALSGVYYVRVENERSMGVQKIIIE
jgi:xyloglucan-specific exo-beta-1,4-glucanase